jgi:hypothetical protein
MTTFLGAHPDRFAGKDVGFPSPPSLYRDRFDEPFTLAVRSGRVGWHGKDREEVYRRAIELRPKRFAIVHTAKPA